MCPLKFPRARRRGGDSQVQGALVIDPHTDRQRVYPLGLPQ